MSVPWHRQAKELVEGMLDPNILFTWPLARVFAVFYLDSVKPAVEEIDVSTPERMRVVINARRLKKGLPPLPEK